MGRRGDGYGSEDHLRRYLDDDRPQFDRAVARAAGVRAIEWLPYPQTSKGDREFQRLEFLPASDAQEVLDTFKRFWPTTGKGQTWDLVGRAGKSWLLVEAKASWPEFVSSSCGASPTSMKTINKALTKVKADLKVHRFFDWRGTYYQHANRLAALWFLRQHGVDARLVGVQFYGDVFPDGTPCPRSRAQWQALIEARRLTMGLPKTHRLSRWEHHVFLPALSKS